MADDVKIRQADMLRSYSGRFKAFGDSINSAQGRMGSQLNGVDSRVSQQMNSLKQSQQSIEHQYVGAVNQLNLLLQNKESSPDQINRATMKVEKLKKLKKKAAEYVEQGRKLQGKCRVAIQDMNEMTKDLTRTVNENVKLGNDYVNEAVNLITDYKKA